MFVVYISETAISSYLPANNKSLVWLGSARLRVEYQVTTQWCDLWPTCWIGGWIGLRIDLKLNSLRICSSYSRKRKKRFNSQLNRTDRERRHKIRFVDLETCDMTFKRLLLALRRAWQRLNLLLTTTDPHNESSISNCSCAVSSFAPNLFDKFCQISLRSTLNRRACFEAIYELSMNKLIWLARNVRFPRRKPLFLAQCWFILNN